jgi:predicted aspartyl protease
VGVADEVADELEQAAESLVEAETAAAEAAGEARKWSLNDLKKVQDVVLHRRSKGHHHIDTTPGAVVHFAFFSQVQMSSLGYFFLPQKNNS